MHFLLLNFASFGRVKRAANQTAKRRTSGCAANRPHWPAYRANHAACNPDFFLFDKERRLVYRGQMDDSRPGNGKPVTGADLRAAVDNLLSGRSISQEQKPSVGCSIKWKAGNAPDWA